MREILPTPRLRELLQSYPVHEAQTAPGIRLLPKVSLPETMCPGLKYRMTVDLDWWSPSGEWPYHEEEQCFSVAPHDPWGIFRVQVVPDEYGEVMVHRFGGSYGPASFVISAEAEHPALTEGMSHPLL